MDNIKKETIFFGLYGSHLYGFNTPASDIDLYGVFIPKEDYIFGLKQVETINNSTNKVTRNTSEDKDETFYTLKKYTELLLNNAPTVIELLFSTKNSTMISSDCFREYQDNYEKFVSKKVLKSFIGFSHAQERKLIGKGDRFHQLQEAIEYLETKEHPEKATPEFIKELSRIIPTYKGSKNNVEQFPVNMLVCQILELFKNEYAIYGWRLNTDTFETLGYDVKFGHNMIRLLVEAIEIMRKGRLDFPIEYKHDFLMGVKTGKVDKEELLSEYEILKEESRYLESVCTLRDTPDFNFANSLCVKWVKYYMRF